jgi:DNA-binding transcriptional ArsR family regulator
MPPSSSELITAVSHPTRRRILRAFVEEPLGAASADELADALEQPVAQVGYHLKTLARCEILRLSRDDDRNAAEAPHYGWALDLEPDWLRVVLDVWVESRAAN